MLHTAGGVPCEIRERNGGVGTWHVINMIKTVNIHHYTPYIGVKGRKVDGHDSLFSSNYKAANSIAILLCLQIS